VYRQGEDSAFFFAENSSNQNRKRVDLVVQLFML